VSQYHPRARRVRYPIVSGRAGAILADEPRLAVAAPLPMCPRAAGGRAHSPDVALVDMAMPQSIDSFVGLPRRHRP